MSKVEKSKTFLQECIEEITGRWRKRQTKTKRRWQKPFIFVDCVFEWLSEQLRNWGFLEVIRHLGYLAIFVALIIFCAERSERLKAKHYQAWQVINSAQGKAGSGGRTDALQDLHSDGVSLVGVNISKAYLPKVDLESADLTLANLSGTYLSYANLGGTNLSGADLSGAYLSYANLGRANLSGANLTSADLRNADLASADLRGANLSGADLRSAGLASADLRGADLAGARLIEANITGANLYDADLAVADLRGAELKNIKDWQKAGSVINANIFGVMNPPDGFAKWAIDHGAVSIESYAEWKKQTRGKTGGQ